MNQYTRTKEKLVYANSFIELFDDEVIRPDGTPGTYVRLRYRGNPPGVVILPRFADGRYVLLAVNRYAAGEESLEFPRGSASTDESAEQGARRELEEETRLVASSSRLLGYLRPDTAIVETEVRVFLMEIPEEQIASIELDEAGEAISSYQLLALGEIWAKIRAGTIRDGFTIGALGLLAAQGAAEL
ncbi:MAG TPA: NUDIX hydrolase [Terracidiphilus sp.]|jgi:8-oxo-dGTP pyrophosphatase MutT (NUDIX family)